MSNSTTPTTTAASPKLPAILLKDGWWLVEVPDRTADILVLPTGPERRRRLARCRLRECAR